VTRIEAPSRLHFGLLSLPVPGDGYWANGLPKRRFGGVGLMIDAPGVKVNVTPAHSWSARGPSAERALSFARTFAATIPESPPFAIEVESCPEEHTGLGTGTALALSVAKAIAVEMGHEEWPAVELARRVGRGKRSAVGIHGFELGGLIIEAG
jgi:beta-RFAP synthase